MEFESRASGDRRRRKGWEEDTVAGRKPALLPFPTFVASPTPTGSPGVSL